MSIIELAKWNFEGLNEIDHPMMCIALQAFAQAVIEDYKAGLVPVAWMHIKDVEYIGRSTGISTFRFKPDIEFNYALYALPSGETK